MKSDCVRFERGTVSKSGAALEGLYASLKYFNNLTMEEIEKRVKKLSGLLIEELKNIDVHVNTLEDSVSRAGVVTYTTGSHELNQKSYVELNKGKISVSLRYSGGVGGIRTSTHFYTTEEDIMQLINIQKKIIQ